MPAIALVGAQWGDEGKGKATDLVGDRVDYVVRYQGGNNAGHTVVIGDQEYALHLLPSGILTPGVIPVIANGVVIDPAVLFEELDALTARGVDVSRLLISANAHLIMPYHRALDKVSERFLGKGRIGTTGRGIGPTYADKTARAGVRVLDMFDPKILRKKLELALNDKNQILTKVYNRRALEVDRILDEYLGYAEKIRPYVVDTSLVLNRALDEGKTVFLEVAGHLLDIDHGTYPFVTPRLLPRVAPARVPGSAPPVSPRSSASPRPTPPASGRGRSPPSWRTSGASGCAPRATSTASPRAATAAAAGSTRRSPATPPGSTASPTSSSPSWTCCPGWSASRSVSPTTSTGCGTTRSP